eukprot:TRINITY_DN48517_c0_g1_i1.p1 TRINITY_DN48517_c0_g1~~TRINITY_DN48517_c0_g1_i1.p1  ORF type:complete len:304 (-),score=66.97 TRINITY_DN48517_c0_g1_i1:225-1136(-)
MAEAAPMETESKPAEPERRLIESTLYKEDVLVGEHHKVWGSWYNKDNKRWGYGCCKIEERDQPCTNPIKKEAPPDDGSSTCPEDESTDSEAGLDAKGEVIIDWRNPPTELKKREDFPNAIPWVEHFVRYVINQWQEKDAAGFPGFGPMEAQTFKTKDLLKQSVTALEVLLRRLQNPRELERSEKTVRKGRETRAGMEGKVKQERSVLLQLDEILTNASKQEYHDARAGYMKMTLGNKTWNNTFVTHVAACTMKGAREYRRNRDNFNTYDMDPDSQKYMHALLKLVMFLQCLRPNTDHSKNVVF